MKTRIFILAILLLAIFLRFYRINENLVFHGELGANYLFIKNTIGKGILPLLGPPTSHPWLSFGPLFYYIFGPFLIINNYNPNSGAYFFAAISVIALVANYYVVKKLFNKKIALISSFLIAISPTWLDLARQARFFSFVTYLFYPFLYLLIISLKNQKYLFWLGLVFGIMLNFHLTPIFLLPPILILFIKKYKILNIKYLMLGIIGFIIPSIPFLIYNIKTHFGMLTKFAVWIPYRSFVYHNFNLFFMVKEIYNFLGGLLLIPILLTFYLQRKNKVVRVLFILLAFGIFALILHKDPPSHYFYVLYPIPVILLSIFISKLNSKLLIVSLFLLITVINFGFLFSNKWFFIDQNKVFKNTNVPYKLQLLTVNKIIKDAKNRPFNLKRVGYSDQFENYYEQNYDYLLWLKGNEPKKYKTNLSYTIIEYPDMQILKK